MAIVRGNYTRSKSKAKATVRYITHRPTRTGERSTRTLFGFDGEITKDEAYRMIDSVARGTVFFHLKISPDPKRENSHRDLDLRDMTRQIMLTLEERFNRKIQFLAAEHTDHSPYRHVHAVVMIRLGKGERLTVEDYQALREAATHAAQLERRALDIVAGLQLDRSHEQRLVGIAGGRARASLGAIARDIPPPLPCPDCGDARMQKIGRDLYRCTTCGHKQERGLSLGL